MKSPACGWALAATVAGQHCRDASLLFEPHRMASTHKMPYDRNADFPQSGTAADSVRVGVLRPAVPVRSEEHSCLKNWLYQRPPMKHGSPY